MARPGLTDTDRERMTKFVEKTYLDRSPDDLLPGDEE